MVHLKTCVILILVTAPFCSGTTANYNQKNLDTIPLNIPPGTTLLKLNRNNILEVNQDALVHLSTTLKTLYMEDNNITSFTNVSVVGKTLTGLYLSFNRISWIDRDLLEPLVSLEVLDLHENLFTTFPDLTPVAASLQDVNMEENNIKDFLLQNFSMMTALMSLDLDWNDITMIPYLNGTSIETFSISHNPLSVAIPADVIQSLMGVKTLAIRSAEITEVPVFGQTCPTLQTLDLSHNEIAQIDPHCFNGCNQLTTLHIISNILTGFPNVSLACNALKVLRLSENMISILDNEFLEGCLAMEELDLDDNKLTQFPDVQPVKATLKILKLNFNNINFINGSFLNSLTKLQTLLLSGNKLTSFPNVPGPGKSLTTLTIAQNKLNSVPDLCLIGKTLTYLTVAQNTGIFDVDLDGLASLKELYLEGTSLTVLPSFHNLSLTHLSLSTSKHPTPIQEVSPYTMAALGRMEKVWLQGE